MSEPPSLRPPPHPVILAKNLLVWLSQLSSEYGIPLHSLADIPVQELEMIAERGFTVLWLIGIWERSKASETIKRLTGLHGESSSAYAVRDYRIAEEVGGHAAFETLRSRCDSAGLSLACDFIPNHDALDSVWITAHPERFVSSEHPPYDSYSFTGPDVSQDPGIGLYIEDHYRDRSDAAVVFKREDRGSGETLYIYHGNDGTDVPWNDTAQIDFLNPETREAVIRRLLDVAADFPVVRLDAAMVLTRDHFRRLWYPSPGDEGWVPSRERSGVSGETFDRSFPEEFWRDALERVSRERPGTLLIAEVMWMLEGYFVRGLGMPAVYDNTDMPRLMGGDVKSFTDHLREVLAADPAELGRCMRFLENPDGATAAARIGTGDRYFALCAVLAALPGIPLFGHGQIEGAKKSFSMSAREAEREDPEIDILLRHEEEIFPLLRKRALFAGTALFELFEADGDYEGKILAFGNGAGDERIIVVFNDSERETVVRLCRSAPRPRDGVTASTAASFLGLGEGPGVLTWVRAGDGTVGCASAAAVGREGLTVAVRPSHTSVLEGFSVFPAGTETFTDALLAELNRRGPEDGASIFETVSRETFRRELGKGLSARIGPEPLTPAGSGSILEAWEGITSFCSTLAGIKGRRTDVTDLASWIGSIALLNEYMAGEPAGSQGQSAYFRRVYGFIPEAPAVLLLFTLLERTASAVRAAGYPELARAVSDTDTTPSVADALLRSGASEERARTLAMLISLLVDKSAGATGLRKILDDPRAMSFLKINEYRGILWFDRNRYGDLLWWMFAVRAVIALRGGDVSKARKALEPPFRETVGFLRAGETSAFRFRELLRLVDHPGDGHAPSGPEGAA